jgi:hypothetical protein
MVADSEELFNSATSAAFESPIKIVLSSERAWLIDPLRQGIADEGLPFFYRLLVLSAEHASEVQRLKDRSDPVCQLKMGTQSRGR